MIIFDPIEHKYKDSNGDTYISVTQLIGKIEHEFHAEYWSIYRALDKLGHRLVPDAKHTTITVNGISYTIEELKTGVFAHMVLGLRAELIREEWEAFAKERSEVGNIYHDDKEISIRAAYYGETKTVIDLNKYNTDDGKFNMSMHNQPATIDLGHASINSTINRFLRDGYKIFPEKIVWLSEYKVAGKSDVPLVNFKKKLVHIVDWKTNKDKLEFESGYYKKVWNEDRTEKIKTDIWVPTKETFKYPLDHLPAAKGIGYQLQLSLYGYMITQMLEKQTGEKYTCNGCTIIHQNETSFKKIPVAYIEKEAKTLLEWWRSLNEGKFYRRPMSLL